MTNGFYLRSIATLARAMLAMPFAAGVCAQAVITTPGGLEVVPAQEVITTPGGLEVVPPSSPQARLFGAIAYQQESGAVGWSSDYPTARDADLGALSRCGDRRCEVVLRISGACGALASGPQGTFTATGETREAAEQGARSACNDPTCSIAAWACTK